MPNKRGHMGHFAVIASLLFRRSPSTLLRMVSKRNAPNHNLFPTREIASSLKNTPRNDTNQVCDQVCNADTQKINVAYVIWSLGLGGAEQVVINLAKGLNREKYSVMICCLNDRGSFADSLEKIGIKVEAIHKKRGIDFSVIFKLIKIFKENKISIVHTHLWGANVWGRIAARMTPVCAVVVSEHNVDVWKKWYHKWIDRILVYFCDRILAVSGEVKKFYTTDIKIPAGKIDVIYNGVSVNSKSADSQEITQLKQEFKIPPGAIVLSNIGRLVEAKANHIFIEALEIVSKQDLNFHALIVGDGPLKEDLIKKGQHLIRLGQLTLTGLRKDIDRILDITDISVLSSSREGFSIVILESMAKGIPVVATDVGGNRELVVNGETGLLVESGSAVFLAEAILEIINNKRMSSMGQAGFKRVQRHFSLEHMISQTEYIYEKVLTEKVAS